MGVASLVIGIIAALFAFIPGINAIMFLPAIVGLVLGIVDLAKKSKSGESKGLGIAGVILNSVAIVLTIIVLMFVGIIGLAFLSSDFKSEIIDTNSNRVFVDDCGFDCTDVNFEYDYDYYYESNGYDDYESDSYDY